MGDLSILQQLKPGEWLFIEFIIPAEPQPFYEWVRAYVSSAPKGEMTDFTGKKRVRMTSVSYDPWKRVGVGSLQVWENAVYSVVDTIAFIFVGTLPGGRFHVSGNCDPIVIGYFIRMLNALAHQWPEAAPSVEQYAAGLHMIARGLKAKKSASSGKRSQYTLEERDRTVEKWELQRKGEDAKTLDVFLVNEFGEKDTNSIEPRPIVAKSTFYDWRKDYYRRFPELRKKSHA